MGEHTDFEVDGKVVRIDPYDGELIAATSELISALDGIEEYRATRPFGILGTKPQARELAVRLLMARAWVNAVLADRPTPVGTAPSPEYATR